MFDGSFSCAAALGAAKSWISVGTKTANFLGQILGHFLGHFSGHFLGHFSGHFLGHLLGHLAGHLAMDISRGHFAGQPKEKKNFKKIGEKHIPRVELA
jgi:hypothetical protein